MRRSLFALIPGLALLAAVGCTGSSESTAETADTARGDQATAPLVVYCGRKEALVGPLLQRFQDETGIELEIHYGQTPELANRLAQEEAETPCDVIYGQETGYLGALGHRELIRELPEDLIANVGPAFQDHNRRWLGVSGRLRVLVYNSAELAPADLPDSLEGLADERWRGRLGWAPTNASFQAHVSVLRHVWGEERTREWLTAVRDNEPQAFPKNSPQVLAAGSGEIAIGWVNHYYLHKLAEQAPAAANYSFPAAGDLGNVMMVSGVGISAHSDQSERAQRLLEFLVSESAQNFLAQEGFEYPAIPAVSLHEDVTPLSEIDLADVKQEYLTDIEPTVELLRDLGLL